MVDEATLTTSQFQLSILAGIMMAGAVALAEWFHGRRIARIRVLAFGPTGRAALWTRSVAALRTIASGVMIWALVVLYLLPAERRTGDDDGVTFQKLKHIVLVLDVSPSMRLIDAGPEREQSRMARAREVMESYFRRIPMKEYRVSVVATYTSALPVVKDTSDSVVLENILNDLPMHFAFRSGETALFTGIQEAASVCRGWRPKSTTVVIVTDGDTVSATGMPTMPASVSDVVVVGVGDSVNGSFINGKHSRQDVSTLRQIAIRLKGYYHNGNEKHLPSDLLRRLTMSSEGQEFGDWGLRNWAILGLVIASTCIAAIPLVLHYFGTFWQPGIRDSHRKRRSDIDNTGEPSQNAVRRVTEMNRTL